MRHMETPWSRLKDYARTESVVYFSTEFGVKFLKEKYNIEIFGVAENSYKRGIRRAITILSDYQNHGIIFKRQSSREHVWGEGFHEFCENFMNDVAYNRLSKGTIRQYRGYLEKLTLYLANNGITDVSEIRSHHIDSYITTYKGYAKSTISYACYITKTFFEYLFNNDLISVNLSSSIPIVRVNQRSNLPSVFTNEEIERLLNSVDRGNPQGKRDYAILVLAIRYGFRVGDITSLKLNDLNFINKTITFEQSKTGNIITVDMIESVGWALIDYLKNARPITDSINVFVRLVAPYDAFVESNNLTSIIQKYLTRADIKREKGRHYGMHTIRHTLASHLLEQGTPIHVISEVLGHQELETTMCYAKIDLPMLELCALEVPDDK